MIAQAEAAVLASYLKTIMLLATLAGWSFIWTRIDDDLDYFLLPRTLWNSALFAVTLLAFASLLFIPFFILGWMLCLLLLAGGLTGYAFYHNSKVPESEQWTLSLDFLRERVSEYQHQRAQRDAQVVLTAADGTPFDVPMPASPQAFGHQLLEDLLMWGLTREAQVIEIFTSTSAARITISVDGVAYPQTQVNPQQALQLIDYVKMRTGLSVQERRKRLQSTLHFRSDEHNARAVEVITHGSTRGITLILNLESQAMIRRRIDDLGLLPAQVAQLRSMITTPGHVVLVCGPGENGIRSTAMSLLGEHDPYLDSVLCLETQRRVEIEGVDYRRVPTGATSAEFNEELNRIVRMDPAVVMLDQMADDQTARIMASVPEVRFYVPVRANTALEALQAYIRAVGNINLAADSLGAIVSQRLIRKLCMTCRIGYRPDPAMLKKLNLSAARVDQLYKHSGQVMIKDQPQPCPDCHGLGYRGRTGIYEVMIFDDRARELIRGKQADQLKMYVRKQGMIGLQEAAMEKVLLGMSDVKEITRALSQKDDAR